MKYDAATGAYGYGAGAAAGYVRRVRAVQVSPSEMKIYSTVFWAQGSGTYSVNFSESVYNWIE
ncbi:MAG: hypothetical protein WDN09_02235 [bacterium]